MLGRTTVRLVLVATLSAIACGPYLPPTTVPPPPDPSLEPFNAVLQSYLDQTQPFRKQAAEAAERVPGKADPTPTAEASVRVRANVLADALATRLRPAAKQGDLLVPAVTASIRKDLDQAFGGLQRDLLLDALAEQNDTGRARPTAGPPQINKHTDAPRVPPIIGELLPQLPKQLEYAFQGRALVLRDIDAQVTLDYLPDALPEPAPPAFPPSLRSREASRCRRWSCRRGAAPPFSR